MREGMGRTAFNVFNAVFLTALGLICLLPIVHVFAVSLSSSAAAGAGIVALWPVQFTTAAYKFALTRPQFIKSLFVSVERIALGGAVNMLLTLLTAYPLSKDVRSFKYRTTYAWFYVCTMFISGGLIPTYMIIKSAHLFDTIWALVLPGALPVFNMILLLNFFRQLPHELEEAALVDGAGHWTVLWKIYVPLSLPALATLVLFCLVGHWNAWFDGLLYMNRPGNYPLSSYLQTVVVRRDTTALSLSDFKELALISDRTFKAAQIFVGMLPILLVYPFLQRYFVSGLTLGGVKG
jgi:putative aldouronate transport system permease protein